MHPPDPPSAESAAAWLAAQSLTQVDLDINSAQGILRDIQCHVDQIHSSIVTHMAGNAVSLNLAGDTTLRNLLALTCDELVRVRHKTDQSLERCTSARQGTPTAATLLLHRTYQLSAASHQASVASLDRCVTRLTATQAALAQDPEVQCVGVTQPVLPAAVSPHAGANPAPAPVKYEARPPLFPPPWASILFFRLLRRETVTSGSSGTELPDGSEEA